MSKQLCTPMNYFGKDPVVGEIKLRRRGVISLLGYVLSGLALMTFAFPLPHTAIIPFFVLPAAFLVGFGINVMQTIWVTLLYELVPPKNSGASPASIYSALSASSPSAICSPAGLVIVSDLPPSSCSAVRSWS